MTQEEQPYVPAPSATADAPTNQLGQLDQLVGDAQNRYGNNPNLAPRLEQLRSHVETVKMVLQHLADEAERMPAQ